MIHWGTQSPVALYIQTMTQHPHPVLNQVSRPIWIRLDMMRLRQESITCTTHSLNSSLSQIQKYNTTPIRKMDQYQVTTFMIPFLSTETWRWFNRLSLPISSSAIRWATNHRPLSLHRKGNLLLLPTWTPSSWVMVTLETMKLKQDQSHPDNTVQA